MDPFIVEFLIFPAGIPDVKFYISENVIVSIASDSGKKKKSLCSLVIVKFEYHSKISKSNFGEVRGLV